MTNQIENYIARYGKLHPAIINKMQKFFKHFDLGKVKIKLVSPSWGKLSGRGGPTAAFVIGGTFYIMRGAINRRGLIRGNSWDLSVPVGFATVAHEIFHVYQYKRDGFFKFSMNFFAGLFRSITKSKMLYDHKYFVWEQEAIKFDTMVKAAVKNEDLSCFVELR